MFTMDAKRRTGAAARWRRLVAEQERSGLAPAEFAARHGFKAATLYWWRSRLKRVDRPMPKIVPIQVVGQAHGGASETVFELELRGGRVLRVPHGFDEHELGRLIGVLERAC